ncbi:MAG: putative hydrolase of the superfamily [Gaiellaceae bacterium]|jgi:putative hydrolase of the HAD superfamily|nr:putative hydrolase of the superfamily [Gaiellaceae bacterium]MDX6492624.1 putative hydrolase of the superfamily [Gaiellaceae bacterium]
MRAVIFDLWDTLVFYDVEHSRATERRIAERLGVDPDRFHRIWRESRSERDGGSLADSFRSVGATDESLPELLDLRRDAFREVAVPREGALETLRELRERGFRLGMISVCSDEVAELWEETPFAGLFDSTVFSCSVGLRKPDPAIYRLALDELDVEPADVMFVGDGANDELAGAERVGMRAVLILRPEQDEPHWEEARGWQPRITSIPEVLDLVE